TCCTQSVRRTSRTTRFPCTTLFRSWKPDSRIRNSTSASTAWTETERMQRRDLLAAALLAAGLPYPALGGSERRGHYLSTAADPEGQHWLVAFGTGEWGVQLHYRIPLPARGHHVAVHPGRGLYAVIARRPDTWLMLGDLYSGE